MTGLCMCNKVAYASKGEAKAAKRDCQRAALRGNRRRQERRIYRCSAGVWHLASSDHDRWGETA